MDVPRSAAFRFPARPLVLGAALLALFGCAKRETAVESGNRTQTLHIGNAAEPPDLDPHTNNAAVVATIMSALFEGLVRVENDGTTIRPGIAESWVIADDGLTYTFRLRVDAVWSNGDPVTADDFLAGMRRFLEPKLGCEGVNFVFPIVGARDFVEGRSKDFTTVGIKAPDPRTVVITLAHRTPYFLSVLADSHIVPLHQPSLDRFKGRDQRGGLWTRPGNLISNGPFTLAEWKPNVVVALAKNPRYWDAARMRLEAVRFYPIEDAAVEERAYRAGQLHVTNRLPQSKIAVYAAARAPELRNAPALSTRFVTFNTQRPPFTDARVRRAFALAIDRERLAASVIKGRGEPAYSYVRPGTGGYSFPPFHRHDDAAAKQLLAAAGFPGGAGFPALDYTVGSNNPDDLLVAQALQQMWQKTLGVKVGIASVEFKVWLDLLRTKTFAVTADGWNMAVADPSEMLALGVTGDPNNSADWREPRYDAAFAQIASAPDEPSRRAAIAACEKLIADEAPYAPVYFALNTCLVHPSVRGWRDNLLGKIDWAGLSLDPAR